MLHALSELAKNTQAKSAKKTAQSEKTVKSNNSKQRIEPPEWWLKLKPAGRDTYLRAHPASMMTPFLEQELRDRLKKNPEERKQLRNAVKKIAKNPKEALAPDLAKIEKAGNRKISSEDEQSIEDDVKEAMKPGKSKGILKAIGKGLAIAGALTIGSAIIATGGLPYAILAIRMIGDTAQIVRDIKRKKEEGEHTFKAMMQSIGETISRSARDPAVIASAIAIDQRRASKNSEGEKVTKAKMSGDKDQEDVKTQQKSPKQTSQEKPKQPIKPNVIPKKKKEEQAPPKNEKHDSNKINLDDEEGDV